MKRNLGSLLGSTVIAAFLFLAGSAQAQAKPACHHTPPAVGSVKEYAVPTVGAAPAGITVSHLGAIWYTENQGNAIAATIPGVLTQEYPLPTVGAQPAEIVQGSDLAFWFTESAGQIGRIDLLGNITEYPVPGGVTSPFGIAAGPDGNIWFTNTSNSSVGKITTAGVISIFSTPTLTDFLGDITVGSDGNLWFVEASNDAIASITTAGVITEYFLTPGISPFGITSGRDGNLWFTEQAVDKVGVFNIKTHVETDYSLLSVGANPSTITAGADGNVWATEPGTNGVARVTPKGVVTEYQMTTAQSNPLIIASAEGTLFETAEPFVWVSELEANNIASLYTGDVDVKGSK